MPRPPAALAPSALYVKEAEVARLVLGPGRASEWKGIAVVLERTGFPQVDPLMGGRYWPAVLAWLDRRHGVGLPTGPHAPDGPENWSDERPKWNKPAPMRAKPEAKAEEKRC